LGFRVTPENGRTDVIVVNEAFPGEPPISLPFNQALKPKAKPPEVVRFMGVASAPSK
jgi:hypothetical protein